MSSRKYSFNEILELEGAVSTDECEETVYITKGVLIGVMDNELDIVQVFIDNGSDKVVVGYERAFVVVNRNNPCFSVFKEW